MRHVASVTCLAVFSALPGAGRAATPPPIDRHALVSRHNPHVVAVTPGAPLSVGNGRFAFTADVTGLQTFPDLYHEKGIPIETMARWAWHSLPNPRGYRLEDTYTWLDTHGRKVGYPTIERNPAGQWLRQNPHVLPLAEIGFELRRDDGSRAAAGDLAHVAQTLDLWSGTLTSAFEIDGMPVHVTTVCHPELDLLAVTIDSARPLAGRLAVRLAFPFTHDLARKLTPRLDWSQPDRHTTRLSRPSAERADFARTLDDTRYAVSLAWSTVATLEETGTHAYRLAPGDGTRSLSFVVGFAPQALGARLPDAAETGRASAVHWRDFWSRGGALDLAGSRDPRATELERRVVLSQYLAAIQLDGGMPPQESGLTCSTWYGKHHTEMAFWHLAHFALWGRDEPLARGLDWFVAGLPAARALARERGLTGARWPKMVGPDVRESPGGNPLIAWNQPHPIHLAELLYRNRNDRATLERYSGLVFETAEAMAAFAHEEDGRFSLGPPLWISQEIYDRSTSRNPAFELAQWRFGLETAQRWRERLGLGREPRWQKVIEGLAPLPVKDGRYVALESQPDTFDVRASRADHPTMLAPLGVLPGRDVDEQTMDRTLDAVLVGWDWEAKIWGWDYPMIAMTATRLGRPETALDVLLKDAPNNHYAANGHCPQRDEIAVYLPANGALLTAVALMAAGWDGSGPLPGFPKDGSWNVRAEGLRPLP